VVGAALARKVEASHLVHVHGGPGMGKTSLVAEYASAIRRRGRSVLWYRFRPGVNDSLAALLFEIGEVLAAAGRRELADKLSASGGERDVRLLTRIALRELTAGPDMLVLDDYHLVGDPSIESFVVEAASRVPSLRVVRISRHRPTRNDGKFALEVPPLTGAETAQLLHQLVADPVAGTDVVVAVRHLSNGVPQLVKLAAAWVRTATAEEIGAGAASLADLDEVQNFLLDSITELLGSDDRAILDAASVFRDRFTDHALAFVSQRPRGTVKDASRRLVQGYVATRSREGGVAFFHTSVRDYVYARLDGAYRAELHLRAAQWCRAQANLDDYRYHLQASESVDAPLALT
jgi:ATP/maltotriose-dependent transcriptional regulator MalT